jgi:hypothetical protein
MTLSACLAMALYNAWLPWKLKARLHAEVLCCAALLQEMQSNFIVGDEELTEDSAGQVEWRRRAAEALQEIHANFIQESQAISQVRCASVIHARPYVTFSCIPVMGGH